MTKPVVKITMTPMMARARTLSSRWMRSYTGRLLCCEKEPITQALGNGGTMTNMAIGLQTIALKADVEMTRQFPKSRS